MMSKKTEHYIEIGSLILGAVALYLYIHNQGIAAPVAALPATISATGDGQPINLNFQSPQINVYDYADSQTGIVPTFGFLGYGPFY
jgi:hypothetical protein